MQTKSFQSALELDERYLLPLYRRFPALFVRGSGCRLWDEKGEEYLDFLAGIAVCQLGHCHPAVVGAIQAQAAQLMHVSNFLLAGPPVELAKKLCELSGMEKVFFSMDGTFANETALKIAKKHGLQKRPNGDYRILALKSSFHGRTLGSLSATRQDKYQKPFLPLVPGFEFADVNDVAGLKKAFGDDVAGMILEPVQGEGGVNPLTTEFIKTARELCDKHDAFLIFDEVQTGIGRTGTWFNFQQHDVMPDLMALAKGLGSGMPVGACLARGAATETLHVGEHGTTFGGNLLSCAAGLAVIDTIEREGLLENCRKMSEYLRKGLLAIGHPIIEVRGTGLMIAAKLPEANSREIVEKCFERKVILNPVVPDAIRFVPPLNVTREEIDHALDVLAGVLKGKKATERPKSAAPVAKLHDVLSVDDLSDAQVADILQLAAYLKERRNLAPSVITPVENRTVALLFEKPSLRTRVSFEAAIRELGGQPVYLSKADVGMGSRESVKDVASNLGAWCAAVVARLYWHRQLLELATYCDVPIINALTEIEHPCQALGDLMTIREIFGDEKVKIAYVGDANNVANSLSKLAMRLGYKFAMCGPKNFWLDPSIGVVQTENVVEGLKDAKVVYTDVWISMGDEHEQEHRLKVFEPYQVDSKVMALAHKDAIFLHCLPAKRGFEVTDEVIDGSQSKVVQQAENRLHVQKALLQRVLGI